VPGRIYLIEERERTVRISRQNCDQLLYIATDNRETGGVIEVSHYNLTQEDREVLQAVVRSLQKQQERSHGFSLG
jgi:hypothetical protein